MANILTRMFGTKHERDIKKIIPIVEEINRIYESLSDLSDEELKSKTDEFKKRIKEKTQEIEGHARVRLSIIRPLCEAERDYCHWCRDHNKSGALC